MRVVDLSMRWGASVASGSARELREVLAKRGACTELADQVLDDLAQVAVRGIRLPPHPVPPGYRSTTRSQVDSRGSAL